MTDIFKHNFLNENVWILIAISLQFVLKGPVNNIPALVQIVAWCPPGDKPLSEPIMISLLTHICITRPQWVNIAMPLTAAKHNKVHTEWSDTWIPVIHDAQSKRSVTYHDSGSGVKLARKYAVKISDNGGMTLYSVKFDVLWNHFRLL